MPTTINFSAYKNLVQEDLYWLNNQPRSLEQEHIREILTAHLTDRRHYDIEADKGRRDDQAS